MRPTKFPKKEIHDLHLVFKPPRYPLHTKAHFKVTPALNIDQINPTRFKQDLTSTPRLK